MKADRFNQVLSEATNFDVIRWIHQYNGDNKFIVSCKRRMLSNHPLTNSQFFGLKKCFAYYQINKPAKKPSEKQSEKINAELDSLLNKNE